MVWIKFCEFSGFKERVQSGIIQSDTELVVSYDFFEKNTSPHINLSLIIVPCIDGSELKANPIYSLPELLTIFHKKFRAVVKVVADESVPEGYLAVPTFALEYGLQLKPKSLINLRKYDSTAAFKGIKLVSCSELHITDNELTQFSLQHPSETLFILSNEAVVLRTDADESNSVQRVKVPPISPQNSAYSLDFERSIRSDYKLMLLEGQSGSGKTQLLKGVQNHLNYSYTPQKLIYFDCLHSFNLHTISHFQSQDIIVLDHFDELLHSQDSEPDIKIFPKYRELVLLITKICKVIIVVRSIRNFGNIYLSTAPLPVDQIFTHHQANDLWSDFPLNSVNYSAIVHGQSLVLESLKQYILHPLKYHRLYVSNGMKASAG